MLGLGQRGISVAVMDRLLITQSGKTLCDALESILLGVGFQSICGQILNVITTSPLLQSYPEALQVTS
jgi:hypothetical protein